MQTIKNTGIKLVNSMGGSIELIDGWEKVTKKFKYEPEIGH
jgi:hypothetical protein